MYKITKDDIKDIKWLSVQKKSIVIHAIQIFVDFEVQSKEGLVKGKSGDYLMKGIQGELYICDQEIFNKTYNIVGLDSNE